MKKILAILLVLSLLLSLSACSLEEFATNAIKDLLNGMMSGGFDGGQTSTEPPTLPPVQTVIDLSAAKKVESVYMDYYVFTGVTEEAARAYEQSLQGSGYSPSGTGWLNDCAETHFMTYLNGQYPSNVFLCFYKDTFVVTQAAYLRHPGDLWLAAGAPTELIPAETLSSEEDNQLPDFSAGEDATVAGMSAKVLNDVSWKQMDNYGYWLQCRKNYEPSGYFDNTTHQDRLYIESFMTKDNGYTGEIHLAWAGNKAIYIEASDTNGLDEYAVWEYLSAPIVPGLNYLEKFRLFIKSNFVGSGNGFESSGFYYSYYNHATVEDFQTYKDQLISMGFTEEPVVTDNGDYKEYTAAKYVTFGTYRYAIWYQLTLEGSYLEAEVGFSVNEGTHKE
jgi:hypothetical protein